MCNDTVTQLLTDDEMDNIKTQEKLDRVLRGEGPEVPGLMRRVAAHDVILMGEGVGYRELF